MKRWVFVPALLLVASFVQAQDARQAFIPKRKHVAVGAKVVGILLANGQPVLSTEGRSGPADQLVFSYGGNSYRWIYVPAVGNPQITNLQVPLAEKGKIKSYPALDLANPRAVLQFKVMQPYALVEVEVNDGLGSPAGDSFVASKIRVLDGSKEYPLKVMDVVTIVKTAYEEHLNSQKAAIEKALTQAAQKSLKGKKVTGPRERQDLMYLTWLPEAKTMRVHFRTTISDGAYALVGGGNPLRDPPPLPLPPKRKIAPPKGAVSFMAPEEFVRRAPPKGFAIKTGTTFGVEFGKAYVINVKGEVIGTEVLPIETFTRQLNARPGFGGPRPFPLPVPPVKK
ncbi:MAG: hypothetical protein HYX68_21670 [Planctomycetes bacterium]|nr:hypothetical protein [Planctomycetota bacterium]